MKKIIFTILAVKLTAAIVQTSVAGFEKDRDVNGPTFPTPPKELTEKIALYCPCSFDPWICQCFEDFCIPDPYCCPAS